jgi:2-methylisocitrate lyase-like PEP mutase family enzyme
VNAYVEAGASVGMPYSTTIPNLAEAKYAVQSIHAPVLLVNSEGKIGYPTPTVNDYENIGAKIVVYNLSGLLAAAKATQDIYSSLKETGSTGTDLQQMAMIRREVEEMIGLPELYAIEKDTKKA